MKKTLLNGEWNLHNENYTCGIAIPGDIHSALIKNGIIKDPNWGCQEKDVNWVGKSDWIIERKFNFTSDNNATVFLEMSQVDTFFEVYINNILCGKGENQFLRYRFNVTEYLKNGENHIKIILNSAENVCIQKAVNNKYPYPISQYDDCSPNRNLARKTQCVGGWDWGPNIMVSGIYDDIFLESVEDGLFNNLTVTYSSTGDNWVAHIDVEFNALKNMQKEFKFSLSSVDLKQIDKNISFPLTKGINHIKCDFEVKNPYIWKTAGELKECGLKKNTLSSIEVTENDTLSGGKKLLKNICFNALKLISKPDMENGKEGRSFYFENNGRMIFSKGTNWIPCDTLPSKMDKYDNLLQSAFDANINTIRVWGGGFYENECFYKLCDELGLIVWQDCMFACAIYPANEEFLNNVVSEMEYQVPRIQSHPCLGLWCGNNENFGALTWFDESKQNRDRYLVDYDRLYNGTIGSTIKRLDPSHTFWPSSPCAGPDDYRDNWHSDNMGDMHYWSVWHERKSFDSYLTIKPRFVSEFGYESFPSVKCLKTFTPKNELNFTSKTMENHQKSPSGNSIIIEMFSRYFRFPNGFENMVYLSQVQQALAIKTAVSWWKSLKPHCMGSIIWQLNDVWPCPSWSAIEYGGQWKLLQYETQKFYDIVSIPCFTKDNKYYVYISNDTKEKLNATVTVQFIGFDGTKAKDDICKKVIVDLDSTKQCVEIELSSEDKNNYFIYTKVTATSSSNKQYYMKNTTFVGLYKHCDLQNAELSYEVSKEKDTYKIEVSSKKPAFFVSFDTKTIKGRFSTNMITVLPNQKETIIFTPENEIELDLLKTDLIINDLRSTYN
jgi:beta-mannosidase